jgi:hypothetical protein
MARARAMMKRVFLFKFQRQKNMDASNNWRNFKMTKPRFKTLVDIGLLKNS